MRHEQKTTLKITRIVVTFYLLTSFQKSMDKFTDKLGELIQELRRFEK